ncbi:zinc finger, CCHC-type containing protein [Tanacetum coccineum]
MVTSSSSSIHDEFQGTNRNRRLVSLFVIDDHKGEHMCCRYYDDGCDFREEQGRWDATQTEGVENGNIQMALAPFIRTIPEKNAYGKVFLNEEKVTANLLLTGEPRVESNVWYLDNGASNHMTEDRSKFHELDKSVSGRVKFEDGSIVAIMGKGSVLFDCKNGDQRLLNEVYFIPGLESNNISLGQMTEQGSRIEIIRWFWVYMLNGKFEAFEAFKWYKKMVEESSGYKVKTLRTDRGGEFTSKEFAKYCEENGEFLGEVVRHAIYLLNRLPSKSLLDITPYEDWKLRVSRDVVFDEKESWDWCKSMEEERPIAATFTVIKPHSHIPSETPQNSPQTTHNQPEAPEFENVFSGQPYQEDVEADSDLNIAAIDPFSSPSTHSSNSPNAPRPRGFRP